MERKAAEAAAKIHRGDFNSALVSLEAVQTIDKAEATAAAKQKKMCIVASITAAAVVVGAYAYKSLRTRK